MKRFLLLFLIAMLALGSTTADAARKKTRKVPQVDRYASIVIEAETGYVVSQSNPDKKLHPASLTKMMTLYLMFEALDAGRLTKKTRLPVSRHAAFQEPSELGLAAGSTIRAEDAILGLVTKSANDVAVVIAESLGGTESRFGEMMTRKARILGMKNTTFKNASGLHDPAQVSTARDMALLGQALLRDFPKHYKYFSTQSFTYAGSKYGNHNHLMKTYAGMDGIKTGYIQASGFNLVASAARGGTRLIGAVFGGRTSKSRNDHMAMLLDRGFEKVNDLRVAGLRQGGENAAALVIPKPISATTIAARQATAVTKRAPRFNAMGLVTEEGDAGEQPLTPAEAAATQSPADKLIRDLAPRPLNTQKLTAPATKTASAAAIAGSWSIQVGAFANHSASIAALDNARKKLPNYISGGAQDTIVPLMTNRGVIYRARLQGLGREQATQACHMLQGSCLILAAP